MSPVNGVTKTGLEALAIAKGLGTDFIQNQFDAGRTLSQIASMPIFATATATELVKPKAVEPVMPDLVIPKQNTGENLADFQKRQMSAIAHYQTAMQAYSVAMAEYVTSLKAGRKREFGVIVNLTKGIFTISIPDGSLWCSAEGLDAILDNVDILSQMLSGKLEVDCKLDGAEGKTKQKITAELLAEKRAEYRKSDAGKAASAGRRETFKGFAKK